MFGTKRSLVGIDIGSSAVKLVELKAIKGGFQLVAIGHVPLLSDTIVDGHIIDLNHVSDVISRIFTEQAIKTNNVGTSVSGHSVIVKKIIVPYMKDEELQERIRWEAEQHVPFDINDVNLSYEVLVRDPVMGNMEVLLVACKRDKVAQYTQVIAQVGKTPVFMDVDAFALQNAYEINYQPMPTTTVALLDIGASVTSINVVRGTTSLFTRDISAGGNQYTDLLQKELSLTFDQAEGLKRGVSVDIDIPPEEVWPFVDSVTDILAVEVQKTLDFWRASNQVDDAIQINHMLISGGGAKIKGLTSHFSERFSVPVEQFNSFRSIQVDSKFDQDYIEEISPSMAVAVGLASRCIGG